MVYPRSVLRQYWTGERPRLRRLGRWMLGIAVILGPFAFFSTPRVFLHTPRNVIAILIVATIVIIVGRRLLAGRDMHAVLLRRRRREKSMQRHGNRSFLPWSEILRPRDSPQALLARQ